jgi:hypothetical protein
MSTPEVPPKKQILLNAFDMSTVGHLSVGHWKVSGWNVARNSRIQEKEERRQEQKRSTDALTESDRQISSKAQTDILGRTGKAP